ncbi:uncharacterized protein A4U43_C07F20690 [Asparagus officinalis]|uniref:Uncharacterized protein n=1 Tax=Asparagus officinalis TaxID=4686 RepID=A0A5P1EGY7_ASPOF|nr:uncharacterized protein A4U43_C07F20690 [Asparagus officinalis]
MSKPSPPRSEMLLDRGAEINRLQQELAQIKDNQEDEIPLLRCLAELLSIEKETLERIVKNQLIACHGGVAVGEEVPLEELVGQGLKSCLFEGPMDRHNHFGHDGTHDPEVSHVFDENAPLFL